MFVEGPGLGQAHALFAKDLFLAWDTQLVGRGGVGAYSDHRSIF